MSTEARACRIAELQKMPAMKLKATAKRVGVPSAQIGEAAPTKEELIEAILSMEGLADEAEDIAAEEVAPKSETAAGKLVAALFDAADSDGSGFMEETEGKRFLATAGCAAAELDYYWQDLVRTADVNKDGKISKDEFLTYILGDEEVDESGCFVDREREAELTTAMRTLYNDTPAGKLVSALFDVVDADGSGYLEEEEGKRFLSAAGCDDSELEYYWSDIIRTADANKDGKISKDEFLVYILGDEELDASGGFVDKERETELTTAMRSLEQQGAGPTISLRCQSPDQVQADLSELKRKVYAQSRQQVAARVEALRANQHAESAIPEAVTPESKKIRQAQARVLSAKITAEEAAAEAAAAKRWEDELSHIKHAAEVKASQDRARAEAAQEALASLRAEIATVRKELLSKAEEEVSYWQEAAQLWDNTNYTDPVSFLRNRARSGTSKKKAQPEPQPEPERSGPLPANWRPVLSSSGETYYMNDETGETTWDLPTEATRLPHGWEAVVSSSGGTYYKNVSTGETTWDLPTKMYI